MLREYVVSEAMFALGIPTTRSLAVVAEVRHSDTLLPACRPSCEQPSVVGSFQYAAITGDVDLRRLADHAIARHHPHAADAEHLPRAVRGGDCRPGVAGGPMDACRVRPRGDEHRQHDDLRRDHRLRPCAFMEAYDRATIFSRSTTPGVTPTATSLRWLVEPGAVAETSSALLRRPEAGGRTRDGLSGGFRRSARPPGRPVCVPSSTCVATSRTRPWHRSSMNCSLCFSRTTSITPVLPPPERPHAARASSRAGCSPTSPGSMLG